MVDIQLIFFHEEKLTSLAEIIDWRRTVNKLTSQIGFNSKLQSIVSSKIIHLHFSGISVFLHFIVMLMLRQVRGYGVKSS